MKSSLSPEILDRLVGHSVKVTKGKTASGKAKNGLTICKLLSVDGDKAQIIPKGHRRPETVDSSRICIWQKGLHLSDMDESEIKRLMSGQLAPSLKELIGEKEKEEFEIKPKSELVKLEPKIVEQEPKSEQQEPIVIAKPTKQVPKRGELPSTGAYVIQSTLGTYYTRIDDGYEWTSSINNASTYKNESIVNRIIGRMSKKGDSLFVNCTVIDTLPVIQPKQKLSPPKTDRIVRKLNQKAQVLDQMQELFDKRTKLTTKLRLLRNEIDGVKNELTEIEKDIDATVELMNEVENA